LRRIISPNELKAEGSIAAGSLRRACGRDNDAIPRQRANPGIPLSSAALDVLALEATSRDLAIAELLGQILVAAINKDMIHKMLGD